ncbi:lytic transglycosylase domain-containing protein [Streptomyces sp. DSM 110735]|uniref:lytic transglycosylase domain-containing protein n=1 Tax=Streptomyces sp. DSM 110735 TaxID=2775031 RepID=UPI0018F2A2F1|nr:lytic transglycosylase domain-containing protein [Streptomyces sp. DSM 110735]MBJ7904625.1 lytic transglycosylase domain-containing protein [Streptomyces sp. DSM 110735]
MSAENGAGGEQSASNAVRNTMAAGAGCGCLLSPVALIGTIVVVIVFGGLGVLLAPLIALILLFGGGGDSGGSSPEDQASQAVEIFNGDGKGTLDEDTVPDDLVDPIEKAGALCDAIGPIVIAAQVERESSFNASLVGPDGEKGLSQLPLDVFEKYGKDDDDNDKVSALDAADSVLAQGRYLCDLADQAQQAIDDGRAQGTALDLALAAYDVGMDSVLAAKGVPNTAEAQGYVASIRAQFAKYAGVAAPPDGATPGVTPTPTDGSL